MTTHNINLTTRDGITVTFSADGVESVAAAAARQGLTVPVVCGQGGCGACRGTCMGGDYSLAEYNPAALSVEDAKRGVVLLCRTVAHSDLDLSIDITHAALVNPCPVRQGEIVSIDTIAHKTVRLVVRLDADEDDCRRAEFEPGQYMELENSAKIARAYSLSNTTNWSGELEFMIRLQDGGQFSSWLEHNAAVGQKLTVKGPQGGFTLRESGLRPRWFVAGGTGLAPLLSMLRRMAEYAEPHPCRLYFGVNREDELFALAELEQLKQHLSKFDILTVVKAPSSYWTGAVGTPIDLLRQDLKQKDAVPDIYVCGPPGLIAATEQIALENGLERQNVIAESF